MELNLKRIVLAGNLQGVDPYSRSHGRRYDHTLDVLAFGYGRFSLDQNFDQGLEVLFEFLILKRNPTTARLTGSFLSRVLHDRTRTKPHGRGSPGSEVCLANGTPGGSVIFHFVCLVALRHGFPVSNIPHLLPTSIGN